jgi:hypothetical protein
MMALKGKGSNLMSIQMYEWLWEEWSWEVIIWDSWICNSTVNIDGKESQISK